MRNYYFGLIKREENMEKEGSGWAACAVYKHDRVRVSYFHYLLLDHFISSWLGDPTNEDIFYSEWSGVGSSLGRRYLL